jgi:hypothetical protein
MSRAVVGAAPTLGAIYPCRQTPLGPRVGMVGHTHLPMPELDQRVQAPALSA